MEDFFVWLSTEWDQFKDLGENTFRNVSLFIAAIVGLGLAVWRSIIAQRQVKTSENGLNIDRFQKGVAMLGDGRLSVRQAGIFMLSELAQQNMAEYFNPVQKVLCSFIRDRSQEQISEFELEKSEELKRINAKYKKRMADPSRDDQFMQVQYEMDYNQVKNSKLQNNISDDNQTALAELSTLNQLYWQNPNNAHDDYASFMNLSNSHLKRANFSDCSLQGVKFINADLRSAYLLKTSLKNCRFLKADLTDAVIKQDCFGVPFEKMTNDSLSNLILNDGLCYSQLKKTKNIDPDFLEKLSLYEKEMRLTTPKVPNA